MRHDNFSEWIVGANARFMGDGRVTSRSFADI